MNSHRSIALRFMVPGVCCFAFYGSWLLGSLLGGHAVIRPFFSVFCFMFFNLVGLFCPWFLLFISFMQLRERMALSSSLLAKARSTGYRRKRYHNPMRILNFTRRKKNFNYTLLLPVKKHKLD